MFLIALKVVSKIYRRITQEQNKKIEIFPRKQTAICFKFIWQTFVANTSPLKLDVVIKNDFFFFFFILIYIFF